LEKSGKTKDLRRFGKIKKKVKVREKFSKNLKKEKGRISRDLFFNQRRLASFLKSKVFLETRALQRTGAFPNYNFIFKHSFFFL